LVLQTIAGHDPRDSTSSQTPVPDYSAALQKDPKGRLRLGVPKEYFAEGLDTEVKASVEAAIRAYEGMGIRIEEVSLPHTPYALSTYYIIAPAEASSNLARYDGIRFGLRDKTAVNLKEVYEHSRSAGFGPEVTRRIILGTYVLSAGYYDAYYLKAQKVRTLIKRDFDAAFEKVDALITPVAPTAAFKLGEKVDDPLQMYLSDVFTVPVNMAGLPGISIPSGFTQSGLPLAFQLIGKPFDESTLLQLGHAYQQVTDWHTRQPAL
jgi:aspartyl-tRNA(Asn)/glutamyl-tRNA(Gln) amidotransferase subunit A